MPKIVVEVAYNEIQRRPKYMSQMVLRFARITRIRDDKTRRKLTLLVELGKYMKGSSVIKADTAYSNKVDS